MEPGPSTRWGGRPGEPWPTPSRGPSAPSRRKRSRPHPTAATARASRRSRSVPTAIRTLSSAPAPTPARARRERTLDLRSAWPGVELHARPERRGDHLRYRLDRRGGALAGRPRRGHHLGGISGREQRRLPRHAVMAAPVAATLPPFAVAGYDGNALHLAWPAPAGPYTDLLIPNTAATSAGCVGAGTSGCTGTCVDQEYGIQGHPFSLGRTDDGAAWLGYLAIHVDRTCTRTIEVSDNEQFCTCLGTSDLSTGELHLLRGAPDGTQPVEALVLPLEPQSGSDLADDLPFISVRAFGTRVAVAARVQDSVRKLRVITLETGATP